MGYRKSKSEKAGSYRSVFYHGNFKEILKLVLFEIVNTNLSTIPPCQLSVPTSN